MFVMRMLVVAAISFSAAGSGWSLPLGIPPAAEDPVMQQIAPPQCLAYVTWSGTAQPNPQSSNQTEQLLAEEEMRQFGAALMQTIEQAIAKNAEQHGPQEVALSKEAVDWAKIVLSHPAAAYVSKFVPAGGTPDVRAGAILNLAPDTAKLRAKLEKFLQGLRPDRVEVRQVAGLSCCYRTHVEPRDSGQPIDWAVKGNYLAITIGEGELEGLLKRIGNQPPPGSGRPGATADSAAFDAGLRERQGNRGPIRSAGRTSRGRGHQGAGRGPDQGGDLCRWFRRGRDRREDPFAMRRCVGRNFQAGRCQSADSRRFGPHPS